MTYFLQEDPQANFVTGNREVSSKKFSEKSLFLKIHIYKITVFSSPDNFNSLYML